MNDLNMHDEDLKAEVAQEIEDRITVALDLMSKNGASPGKIAALNMARKIAQEVAEKHTFRVYGMYPH